MIVSAIASETVKLVSDAIDSIPNSKMFPMSDVTEITSPGESSSRKAVPTPVNVVPVTVPDTVPVKS